MKHYYLIFIVVLLFISQANAQLFGIWSQKNNMLVNRSSGAAVSLNNRGYYLCGSWASQSFVNDMWEYNPLTDSWSQKASLPAAVRSALVALVINGKIYAGMGRSLNNTCLNDWWEYDPSINTWTQKASLIVVRSSAFAFSVNGKGYVGTGSTGINLLSDLWEYDPNSDSWFQKASFPNGARSGMSGFSIGNKGYTVGGYTGAAYTSQTWEYDPLNDHWTSRASCPGLPRAGAVVWNIGNYGFAGLGISAQNTFLSDFYRYYPVSDIWAPLDTLSAGRTGAKGFTISGKGYVVGGGTSISTVYTNHVWEYTPAFNTTAIAEQEQELMSSIYPNPATDKVCVKGQTAGNMLFFLDLNNRVVDRTTVSENGIIDIRMLPVGLYILQSAEGKRWKLAVGR